MHTIRARGTKITYTDKHIFHIFRYIIYISQFYFVNEQNILRIYWRTSNVEFLRHVLDDCVSQVGVQDHEEDALQELQLVEDEYEESWPESQQVFATFDPDVMKILII